MTDETMGYLLSCSEQGDIIDSIPAYYWNSEGAQAWYTYINKDGSIIMNIQAADGWGDNLTDTTFLQTDGSFTMTNPSVMMEVKETQ